MFFGRLVEASLHMDSAAARGICKREGVGKVKALEVRTLWLQQMIKAKTLTLKTVKSQDNCADLGTKTLTAGTLTLLRAMNGFADKKEMDDVSRAVRATAISSGESGKHRISASRVLDKRWMRLQELVGEISGYARTASKNVVEYLPRR